VEWLLIYLFVMIERVGSMLMFGWLAFWVGIGFFILSMLTSAIDNDYGSTEFADNWKKHGAVKVFKRVAWILIPLGFIVGTLGFLTPSQKDAAIIVGSGVTYNVLTSETGKRLGGKAVELLEQKIDDALATPEAVVAPKVKGNSL
jgi:hypothetical protein